MPNMQSNDFVNFSSLSIGFKSRALTISLALLGFLLLSNCKKEKKIAPDNSEIVSPTTGTRTELTLDSIFLYAKQVYLWNEVLPTYNIFLPREKYSAIKPEITAFKKELFDISQLKINQITGLPYEVSGNGSSKYSYLRAGRTNAGTYQAGPTTEGFVIERKIIASGDKRIAYVALGSFPSLLNSKSKLDEIFADIAAERPKHLILDLRTNGGGYVETAEYLANLIVPSTLNNKVMYVEQFNATLQNGKATILKHQPYLNEYGKPVIYKGRNATMADVDYTEAGNTYKFKKKGDIETLTAVYVIVSNQTASASELLISCLKPYMNVKLVGEQTYGKPVGFFGINIDQYAIYLSSFLIKNAQGWSDYFNGIDVDIPVATDSNPTFGDPNEPCLKAALTAINNNAKVSVKITSGISSKSIGKAPILISDAEIGLGTIENRFRLK